MFNLNPKIATILKIVAIITIIIIIVWIALYFYRGYILDMKNLTFHGGQYWLTTHEYPNAYKVFTEDEIKGWWIGDIISGIRKYHTFNILEG